MIKAAGQAGAGGPPGCPCGDAHELSAEAAAAYQDIAAGLPDTVAVSVSRTGAWLVPRVYIAAHGLKADELPGLAERYGVRGGGRLMTVPPSFACPCCGAVSFHPADIGHGYCGRCHWRTGDPLLGPPHLDGPCPHRGEAAARSAEAAP